jgi:hypothetical protein
MELRRATQLSFVDKALVRWLAAFFMPRRFDKRAPYALADQRSPGLHGPARGVYLYAIRRSHARRQHAGRGLDFLVWEADNVAGYRFAPLSQRQNGARANDLWRS